MTSTNTLSDDGSLAALRRAVRGEVRTSLHQRLLYATDASLYQVEPLAVVVPEDVADAEAAARACLDAGLPILPRGGGTSLAGQCTNRAVILDLSVRCRAIGPIDPSRRRCRAEPGVTLDALNDELAPHGLWYAPDPATSRHATVGGSIGNNAAGSRSVRYGRTSEHVLGVDVLTGAGERLWLGPLDETDDARATALAERVCGVVGRHERLIRERFPRTIRRNAGYNLDLILAQMQRGREHVNLSHLICGSEGTLAVVLGAELNLVERMRHRGLAVVRFETVDEAVAAVPRILSLEPSAVELLDDLLLGLARASPAYRDSARSLEGPTAAGALLYVEFSTAGDAEALRGPFAALADAFGPDRVRLLERPGEAAAAWALRKAGEPLLHGMPGARKPITFVEDCAVPVERLREFVTGFRDILDRAGTRASFWAHASVGVLHVRPLLDPKDDHDRGLIREIAERVTDLARSVGGVMSGEHGDGRVRGPLLERFYGPELCGAFREIKAIFDPHHLLNPGIIVDAGSPGSIIESLRVRPAETTLREPAIETAFDFSHEGGFLGAAEQCNGAGVCRKPSGGVMCPSYMALRDERHATRGRANSLRLLLSGQLARRDDGLPDFADPETHETLDLCLSCKACKRECPSAVDAARLKSEFLWQSYRQRGRPPWAVRSIGNPRGALRSASRTPRLANAIARVGLTRRLMQRLLGVDRRRSLPPAARSLARSFPPEARRPPGAGPAVAIFADCFCTYSEPRIGIAARRVLKRLGYRVHLLDAGCCARPAISMGLLGDARSTIERTAGRIGPWLERIESIVLLEPSCLSAMRDDWLGLKSAVPRGVLEAIAAKSVLIEDFVGEGGREHPAPLVRSGAGATNAILHQHCHQRALLGDSSGVAALRALLGDGLEVLDAGCCGMAGAFGYDRRRFDLSTSIAERVLAPRARRAKEAGEVVVAPGTSCRHQIKDTAGVDAKHPIELIEELTRPTGG